MMIHLTNDSNLHGNWSEQMNWGKIDMIFYLISIFRSFTVAIDVSSSICVLRHSHFALQLLKFVNCMVDKPNKFVGFH